MKLPSLKSARDVITRQGQYKKYDTLGFHTDRGTCVVYFNIHVCGNEASTSTSTLSAADEDQDINILFDNNTLE